MRLAGEQRVAASRQRVWEALNDPEVLRASIPGCQSLDKEAGDRLAAVAEVRIGPIGARFKGVVTLSDLDPPNGYTITGQGNGGIAGNAKGSARVRLGDDGAGGTLVSYDVDAEVGGRMAQLGGPIIDATAKQLAGKFFARFGEIVGGEAAAGPEAAPAASVAGATTSVSAPRPVVAAPAATGGLPVAWVLALVVAAFAGFYVGHGQGGEGSDWAGLAIGLLVIVVAGVAFEYGRRAASPVLVLDSALLRRLIEGARE
jgi:carbon monoxide dehydrogenase subunit G